MENKNFQTITVSIFGFFLLLGVIIFATQRTSTGEKIINISMWGIPDEQSFEKVANEIGSNENTKFKIQYKQLTEDNFDTELIEAIASGVGPDAIILPQDKILKYENKILPIPFSNFSERNFRDNFVEGSEIYLTSDGILGFPIMIDPLVMYWNRDILSSSGIVKPLMYWDEIYSMGKKITEKDNSQNLKRETIALGEFTNIKNSKEIISALIMQSGNSITEKNSDKVESVLTKKINSLIFPAESALRFYTEFSNSSKEMYSWNRALNSSLQEFLAGNLAFYIGFSSELAGLREKNPNLNFDVAKLPQIRDNKTNKTFAKMNAIAILKSSKNTADAIKIVGYLINDEAISLFSKEFNLPPVKRTLLLEKQTDAYKTIFYDSAIIGRAWLDPSPQETGLIFKDMIENVTSGKFRINESIDRANLEIQNLMPK